MQLKSDQAAYDQLKKHRELLEKELEYFIDKANNPMVIKNNFCLMMGSKSISMSSEVALNAP